MKKLLMTSVGALALTTGAGVALAQDSGASATGGASPDVITCAQIVELETDQLERTLYFVAGYNIARDASGGSAAAAGTTTMPTTGTDTTASADTGTATTTTPPAGTDTDTTASADTGAATDDPMADTDTTASADTGTDTTTTAGTTTGTMGGSGSAGAMPEIQIESVMTVCRDSPDQMVSDVLRQQGAQ